MAFNMVFNHRNKIMIPNDCRHCCDVWSNYRTPSIKPSFHRVAGRRVSQGRIPDSLWANMQKLLGQELDVE